MYLHNFYKRFLLDESIVRETGFNPYHIEIESGLSDPVIINGRAFINLASNNYLGLADDDRVKEAVVEVVNRYGASMCGTPVATGYTSLYRKVEERLAWFAGLEAAIIFPSAYQANTGLFTAIAGKDDLVVVDHFAHSSLVQGVRGTGCKVRPFLHNDLDSLHRILEKSSGYSQIFVVTESVFSTEGSIAPVEELMDLCLKYEAVPVIDDSHGIGVLGKTGRGILQEKNIKDFRGIYTASLGKALANSGGIICGKKGIIEHLRYYCPHLVYSTALPPSILGGIDRVLDIIEDEFEVISRKLWQYKNLITGCLKDSGFNITEAKSPITSIVTGAAEDTILLAKQLFENNILSTPFIEPSVPVNAGKVRLIAGANLKEESIEKALNVFKKIAK